MGENMDDIIAIHKQVEQMLRRLSMIAERAREGIIALDLGGAIKFVNPAWAEMYGYKDPDELIGKQIGALRTKGRMNTDLAGFIEKTEQKGEYAGRLECFRKDGTPFAAAMLMLVFNDDGGKAAGLVGFAEDLTEQERTKDELRQYHSNMEELVNRRTEALEATNAQLQRRAAKLEQDEQQLKKQADELTAENKQLRGQIRKHERSKDESKLHCDKLEQLIRQQGDELTMVTAQLRDATTKRRQQTERLKQKTDELKTAGAQLQAQIDELSAGDPGSEADLLKATDSVEAVVSSTDNEKAVLENIFRHNIELQKSQIDDAADDETAL